MIRLLYIALLQWVMVLPAMAQPFSTCDSMFSFPTQVEQFTVDNLGFVYVIKADNSIEKWSDKGILVNQANHKIYGKLHSIDVSNPFEIYLFYKDVNKIVFTDNQLTPRGIIDLNSQVQIQASAIARAFDNGFWAFDLSDLQLKKFTKQLTLQQQSGNILQITQSHFEPSYILDKENKVLVYNDSTGFELFDNFANHLKHLPIKGVLDWQFTGTKIYYLTQQHQLYVYDLLSLQHQIWVAKALPDAKAFKLHGQTLYLQQGPTLVAYKLRE